ncbi:MFS transporter [Tumebacillus sp. DT12]|uniref:MFS transporter n=1 Tax=Tumebacillus lacus TaxID=2995335 RepID=A0ABT3X1U8_9BACL|nr:MFS transporter [Tumebacillus lacus]MCX7570890.1 MFS transporter [Tumebacillus lacus]
MANARQQRKALIASLVGNSIEWYDYFLYGTATALVFNKLFFPSFDPVVGLMLSYLTFALPFFIRPLGGIVFAHIGDRIGRKKTLVATLMLMGVSTVLIGLLPSYESIGVLAPILLVTLRVIQGMGIGGEWGGALLIAVEHSDEKKRALYGSVPQMGVPIGLLLGTFAMSLTTFLTTDEQFLSWGWRVPFLISAVLVGVGFWIRNGVEESEAFQKVKESGEVAKVPLVETLKHHWKEVLLATGMKVVETAPFYIFSTFIISYATKFVNMDRTVVLNSITISTLVCVLLIPVMGRLADRVGRRPLYLWGTVAMILYTFPYFMLVNTGSNGLLILANVIGLGIIWTPITAVLGTLYSEIFSTKVRYTGVTLGYQLGAALAGGTAPLIATALLSRYDNSYVPVAIYLMLASSLSLLAILLTKETKGRMIH